MFYFCTGSFYYFHWYPFVITTDFPFSAKMGRLQTLFLDIKTLVTISNADHWRDILWTSLSKCSWNPSCSAYLQKKHALSKYPNPALLSVAKQVQKRLSSKHDLRFQVKIWLYVHQNIKCIICSNRSPLRDDVLLYQIWRQTHFLRF